MITQASPRIAPPQFSIPVLACVVAFALASCMDRASPSGESIASAARAAKVQPFVAPQDVFERTAHSIVGITYPPNLERFPALAKLLVEHANARRTALAASLRGTPKPPVPYELTLRFNTVADAPRMFAVSADEELYTGGLTSRPAHTVFLWLPAENRLVSPDEMIPNPAAWARLHDYITQREREEAATLAASDTAPRRAMRHSFSPRFNSNGRIAGLRFQTDDGDDVEVPGALLKPLVAPAYADWFDDTPPSPLTTATASL